MEDSRQPLRTHQMAVLRWIGDGCPDGVIDGHAHKATAVALQNRRLVKVSRRGGRWSAELTADGAFYLAHGSYPPPNTAAQARASRARHPAGTGRRPARPAEDSSRRSSVPTSGSEARPDDPTPTKGGPALQLVREVEAAGGELRVERTAYGAGGHTQEHYQNLARAANRYGHVPAGPGYG